MASLYTFNEIVLFLFDPGGHVDWSSKMVGRDGVVNGDVFVLCGSLCGPVCLIRMDLAFCAPVLIKNGDGIGLFEMVHISDGVEIVGLAPAWEVRGKFIMDMVHKKSSGGILGYMSEFGGALDHRIIYLFDDQKSKEIFGMIADSTSCWLEVLIEMSDRYLACLSSLSGIIH